MASESFSTIQIKNDRKPIHFLSFLNYFNLTLVNFKLCEPCYFPPSSPFAANLKQI